MVGPQHTLVEFYGSAFRIIPLSVRGVGRVGNGTLLLQGCPAVATQGISLAALSPCRRMFLCPLRRRAWATCTQTLRCRAAALSSWGTACCTKRCTAAWGAACLQRRCCTRCATSPPTSRRRQRSATRSRCVQGRAPGAEGERRGPAGFSVLTLVGALCCCLDALTKPWPSRLPCPPGALACKRAAPPATGSLPPPPARCGRR